MRRHRPRPRDVTRDRRHSCQQLVAARAPGLHQNRRDQRRYPRGVLRRLAFIAAAQFVGLSLDQVKPGHARRMPGLRMPVAKRCALFNASDEAAAEGDGSRWLRDATRPANYPIDAPHPDSWVRPKCSTVAHTGGHRRWRLPPAGGLFGLQPSRPQELVAMIASSAAQPIRPRQWLSDWWRTELGVPGRS